MGLVAVKLEVNPENNDGFVRFAYFSGTPTFQELEEVQKQHCELAEDRPVQYQDAVADLAQLERWCLWY